MRAMGWAVWLSLAAQAVNAAGQGFPGTISAEGGKTVALAAGANLQAALDSAVPGDTIELPAGATFTGNFVLPPKTGTAYITIRTAQSDDLPRANERISPDHSSRLARIQSTNGNPALRTAPGARFWKLILLEFGPNQAGAGDIISLGDGSSAQSSLERVPSDLVVDRCYIHGDPARGQKRGIALNSASTTVVGSYISDIKSDDPGRAGDCRLERARALPHREQLPRGLRREFHAGRGHPGLSTDVVPSDVVFRRNHVSRPASWRSGSWSVKNLFELKNARRVLVEGNLFETHWQGAQAGYAIVFTPRGEGGAAPWAVVEDVTFRYNVVRNVAAVFNFLARDNNGASGPLRRVKIVDNLFYGVDRAVWGGNGTFLQIGEGPAEIYGRAQHHRPDREHHHRLRRDPRGAERGRTVTSSRTTSRCTTPTG